MNRTTNSVKRFPRDLHAAFGGDDPDVIARPMNSPEPSGLRIEEKLAQLARQAKAKSRQLAILISGH